MTLYRNFTRNFEFVSSCNLCINCFLIHIFKIRYIGSKYYMEKRSYFGITSYFPRRSRGDGDGGPAAHRGRGRGAGRPGGRGAGGRGGRGGAGRTRVGVPAERQGERR